MKIEFIEKELLKDKPTGKLGFGKIYTDYMFQMEYDEGIGWHDAQVKPYGPILLEPSSMVLHYAQETFEGMKAYRTKEDKILLFRPEMNAKRINNSNRRICMPEIPEEDFVQAVTTLIDIERDWVPKELNTSLYIRPVCFATEAGVGVHPANRYLFIILLSPVGSYYEGGLSPVKINVEDEYVRAVLGGTGFAKCGGNYASSIIAQKKAKDLGYDQVLWLDAKERRFVEEVGTMNAMFVIDNEIYTAPLDGTILPGITRDSCIKLLESWGYKIHEKPLDINDVMKYAKNGRLSEAFGTGTAAVISPIGQLRYINDIAIINNNNIGEITNKLFNELCGIQWGRKEDKFNWTKIVIKKPQECVKSM